MKSRRDQGSPAPSSSRRELPNSGLRGEALSRMRKLIKEADPDVLESGDGNPFGRTRHHLHWRILQECRKLTFPKARREG